MSFEYHYTVRLADTDAAGIAYFTNVLRWCHEAYEEALTEIGCDWRQLSLGSTILLPLASSSADFLAPLLCGDRLAILLKPKLLSSSEFAVRYQVFNRERRERPCARARTRHVCLERASRQRCDLPEAIAQWASSG